MVATRPPFHDPLHTIIAGRKRARESFCSNLNPRNNSSTDIGFLKSHYTDSPVAFPLKYFTVRELYIKSYKITTSTVEIHMIGNT